jgi:hypothetical protein
VKGEDTMHALDRLIPLPRLIERDRVDLAAEPVRGREIARHLDLSRSPWAHALFAVRTLPSRLHHLNARAEGRLPGEGARDVLAGLGGAGAIALAFLTPFLRSIRTHWGLDAATAARPYPGDDLVPEPRWAWTHGIEIDAPAEAVWPWVAQIGGDRAGFCSHQWLENVVGCNLRNAEAIHPEWAARAGDTLVLHPRGAALRIVKVDPGEYVLGHSGPEGGLSAPGQPWLTATWLFYLEPLEPGRSRFISRFRVDYSDDLAARFEFGPTLVEPVGFVMDRRMLIGVKERAERAQREVLVRHG